MNSRRLSPVLCVVVVALALSACGGGGGSKPMMDRSSSGMPLTLPSGHGLSATGNMPITVKRGEDARHGDVVISCPAQAAADCAVTVENDGTATYTGGMPEMTLAATGGGALSVLDKWQRFENGNPTLSMTSRQVSEDWGAAMRKSTHFPFMSFSSRPDAPSDTFYGEIEADTCDGDWCTFSFAPASAFAPILEHNSIPIAKVEHRFTFDDEEDGETVLLDVLIYGGWLDYTTFAVSYSRHCMVGAAGCSGMNPDYEDGGTTSSSAGMYSGTTPTGVGSATWTGVMVGIESADLLHDRRRPDIYLGDARIVIDDLAVPDVDVAFINIHNVDEGTRWHDMSWENLPIEDGLFKDVHCRNVQRPRSSGGGRRIRERRHYRSLRRKAAVVDDHAAVAGDDADGLDGLAPALGVEAFEGDVPGGVDKNYGYITGAVATNTSHTLIHAAWGKA